MRVENDPSIVPVHGLGESRFHVAEAPRRAGRAPSARGRWPVARGRWPAVALAVVPVFVLAALVGGMGDGPRAAVAAPPSDWPQWGGSPARNNVSDATNLPVEWNFGKIDYRTNQWDSTGARNIRWVARLGSTSYGTPVIAGGKVFCATNNGAGHVRRYPPEVDLGVLLCFEQSSGRFGWQLSREKLAAGRALDWPEQGVCAMPLVEGERAWIVTNRCEVLCLDTLGFYDNQNDGPYQSEPSTDRAEADIVWQFDMLGRLGVQPHNMSSCSVTAAGDLLLVCTSNGVDESHETIPAPEAPSFIALDKRTGELVWADASPGRNILHGQWSSPAFAVIDGVGQAIFAGGDGWLYSFRADESDRTNPRGGPQRRPELLWKFDCNPKCSVFKPSGRGDRDELIATPVVVGHRVFIATGADPEYGEGPGRLWCIDGRKRGDISAELVVDASGRGVAPRREAAFSAEAGEKVIPNPHSGVLWCYTGADRDGDGRLQFEEAMHRTLGMAVVADGLLVIGDLAGLVHCLDAETGRPHWTHDMLAAMWGSPLVADGKIYIADEDGEVAVFELAAERRLLAENSLGNSIYSAPVAVGEVLYIATRTHLVAIAKNPEKR